MNTNNKFALCEIPVVKDETKLWKAAWVKDKNGKYILSQRETDTNNLLGKALMQVREELRNGTLVAKDMFGKQRQCVLIIKQ